MKKLVFLLREWRKNLQNSVKSWKTPGPSFLIFCRTKSKAVVDTTLKLEKRPAWTETETFSSPLTATSVDETPFPWKSANFELGESR